MSNMEDYDENAEYHVQYQTVADDSRFFPITRLLAMQIIANPYVTVGSFFEKLSDDDVYTLQSYVEDGEDEEDGEPHDSTRNLVIMTLMLAQAEGGPAANLDEIMSKTQSFKILCMIESLARQGLAKPLRHNYSLHSDAQNLQIAEGVRIVSEDDEDG